MEDYILKWERRREYISALIFLVVVFGLLAVTYYFNKVEIGISIVIFIVLISNTGLSFEAERLDDKLSLLDGKVDDIRSLMIQVNNRLKVLEDKEINKEA